MKHGDVHECCARACSFYSSEVTFIFVLQSPVAMREQHVPTLILTLTYCWDYFHDSLLS